MLDITHGRVVKKTGPLRNCNTCSCRQLTDRLFHLHDGVIQVAAQAYVRRYFMANALNHRPSPWLNVIAGVAWTDKDAGISRRGATGFGVRLLWEFLRKGGR